MAYWHPSGNLKYYPYYQWVGFVLFLQAVTFYLPHYMWKITENGLMKSLSMSMMG